MLAFQNAMIHRLANDLMDAVETVTKEDPGLRVEVCSTSSLAAKGDGVIESIRVRTQSHPIAEGFIDLKYGMTSSRIAALIREKLKPAD